MTQPMGWFPDPEGAPRERWWDGNQWTSATRNLQAGSPPPQHPKKKRRWGLWIASFFGVVIVAVVLLSISGYSRTSPSDRPSDDRILTVCQNAVKDALKDPDSAQFRDGRITSSTGKTWKVEGEVNARNSFGGYNGYTGYTCDAKDEGSQISAEARLTNDN
ncbi:DUF2510 domain-containing protein [uncultured Williamsia sp.]|uniref:DUF2510 domain-containing protein n=1 Tax=uncultured Williamsia sp. TaxID=259311 RepID=UPI002633674E|nr:DUF2510 domain-containing protein [uncultured Williamsia sp.]